MTPDEIALVRLKRTGKLDSWIAEDQKAREWRAKNAALAGPSAFGQPGGRVTPGAPATGRIVEIPFEEWASQSEETKAALRKQFNDPAVEYRFTNAPRHFDPMTG
jgi:hypothetical protein